MGTEKGFRSLQLVVRRVERHLGRRVQWMTNSEFADWVISRSAGQK